MSGKRALLYVQHLLGVGHLKRSALLADAMTRAGMEVTFVSGGFPVPGIAVNAARFVQLPPAGAADLSFKQLVDPCGNTVDAHWKQARSVLLLEAWQACQPHVLVLELFPFGRRQMRFELLPLLEAASRSSRRPVIVSSVRDVLGGGQGDPARQDGMLALFERYFDHVLVHGDPALIPFDETFRHARRIADKLHYTGYVVEPATPDAGHERAGRDEVIVSAGGGAVGARLLETALLARPGCVLARRRWRVLAGAQAAQSDLLRLQALADTTGGPGVLVERNRPDFVRLLANCRLSVSQGGYNTVMETIATGARSVVVPFAGGAETEQTLRARLLARRGWIDVVEESVLSPRTLGAAIDSAVRRPRRRGQPVRLDGAFNSAALLAHWAAGHAW